MTRPFHITGSTHARPASRRRLYADGIADETYRPDIDIQLSHWLCNETPATYKADTSTEICLNFVKRIPSTADGDLVINNHTDIDGILSVFVLIQPDLALAHQDVLTETAAMGDFCAWGDVKAQTLCHNLGVFLAEAGDLDPQDTYEQAFDVVRRTLAGDMPSKQNTLQALGTFARTMDLFDTGAIVRRLCNERFVLYETQLSQLDDCTRTANLFRAANRFLSSQAASFARGRNRKDFERIQLLSYVDGNNQRYYDLWYPPYVWADTPGLWRPPGLAAPRECDALRGCLTFAPLREATATLNSLERSSATWVLLDYLPGLFGPDNDPRPFPTVLACLNRTGAPAKSGLSSKTVCDIIAPIFDSLRTHPAQCDSFVEAS